MDFLCFVANHKKEYAVSILDMVGIVANPVITAAPGEPTAVVGMTMYRGRLIAVVDMSIMFSGDSEQATSMVVFAGSEPFGVLIEEVHNIVRGQVPDGCEFIDVHDFERSVTTFDRSESHIELF